MQDFEYLRTGTEPDREPACTPYARGLYLAVQRNAQHEEITDDEFLRINLHAQKELSALSSVFAKAQKHWSELPHTPARQMDNLWVQVSWLAGKIKEAQDWIESFRTRPGLVYIFSVEREIDISTGRSWLPPGVVEMHFGFGPRDETLYKDKIRYRMYFAYAEK